MTRRKQNQYIGDDIHQVKSEPMVRPVITEIGGAEAGTYKSNGTDPVLRQTHLRVCFYVCRACVYIYIYMVRTVSYSWRIYMLCASKSSFILYIYIYMCVMRVSTFIGHVYMHVCV